MPPPPCESCAVAASADGICGILLGIEGEPQDVGKVCRGDAGPKCNDPASVHYNPSTIKASIRIVRGGCGICETVSLLSAQSKFPVGPLLPASPLVLLPMLLLTRRIAVPTANWFETISHMRDGVA